MSNRIRHLVLSSVVLFPAIYALTLMWWVPEGDKYVPGMVVLVLIVVVVRRFSFNESPSRLPEGRARLLIPLWLFVTYCAMIYLWKGDSWTELRAMLAMAIYFSICREMELSATFCKLAVAISAFGFLFLTWALFMSGTNRVGGFINPIPYATALGAVLLVVFSLALWGGRGKERLMFSILGVGLLSALFMTQTRGVIVPALFLCGGLLFIYSMQRLKAPATLILFGMFVSLIAVLGSEIFRDRVNQTQVELDAIAIGDKSGSIGLRIQMWEAALRIWKDSPIIGVGDGHKAILKELHSEGHVTDKLLSFSPSHYHNQYLDFLVKKGVLGLALFLTIMVLLLQLLLRSRIKFVGLGGGAALLLYMLSGLSDVPFRHPASIYLFFSIVLVFTSISVKHHNNIRREEGL